MKKTCGDAARGVFVVLMVSAASATAAIPGAGPRTTISEDGRDYQLRGAGIAADGTTHLAIASHARNGAGAAAIVWAAVDLNGKLLFRQNALANVPAADAATLSTPRPGMAADLAIVQERPYLLLQPSDGTGRLVRLGREKEVSIVTTLRFSQGAPTIRRTVPTSGGHLLVTGSTGAQPLLAEVDLNGSVVTRTNISEPGMTVVSAVFNDDGSSTVAGEKGTFPDSTAWVAQLSAERRVVKSTSFPGRPTDLTRGSDGTHLLLVEQHTATGYELLARGIGADLGVKWTRSLASGERMPLAEYRAKAVAGGGFIVAGTKQRGLYVAKLKPDGSEAWADANDPRSSPELELVSDVLLASQRDTFVVAYTAFVVVGREQHQVVRMVRFSPG